MEELIEDKETLGMREKFFNEVEALGEEQILELDQKLNRLSKMSVLPTCFDHFKQKFSWGNTWYLVTMISFSFLIFL